MLNLAHSVNGLFSTFDWMTIITVSAVSVLRAYHDAMADRAIDGDDDNIEMKGKYGVLIDPADCGQSEGAQFGEDEME